MPSAERAEEAAVATGKGDVSGMLGVKGSDSCHWLREQIRLQRQLARGDVTGLVGV